MNNFANPNLDSNDGLSADSVCLFSSCTILCAFFPPAVERTRVTDVCHGEETLWFWTFKKFVVHDIMPMSKRVNVMAFPKAPKKPCSQRPLCFGL